MMRVFFLVVFFALSSVLLGCDTVDNGRTVLKLGHTLDNKHPVHKAMEFMDERLQVLSGGTMSIDIYPSGQLGNERELIELLQIGSLGMTKVSASPLEGFVPAAKVFSMPYLFENHKHFWDVLDSDVGRELLLAGTKYRVRGLTYYDAGSRSFYTRDRAVLVPSDLKGMKIRVQNSQTAVAMVNAMGGSPTPVSFGELYTALQQGVVDGAENNPPSVYYSKHFEVIKYYTLDEHTAIPDVLLMSQPVWESLTKQQQLWLQQAANESSLHQRVLWKKSSGEAMAAMQKSGVQIIRPNKKEFQESVKSIYDDEKNPEVLAMIERIRRMAD